VKNSTVAVQGNGSETAEQLARRHDAPHHQPFPLPGAYFDAAAPRRERHDQRNPDHAADEYDLKNRYFAAQPANAETHAGGTGGGHQNPQSAAQIVVHKLEI